MSENADSPRQTTGQGGEELEDSNLLRRYVEDGSEDAFAELVRRRIGLVYSVALRQTHGDAHRAEDVTQAVFVDLARKAASLARRPVLAGWLYRSAQFAAAGLIRVEQRRLAREQAANLMEKLSSRDLPTPDWDKVRPLLDEALNKISERDRDAIVLRFFDGRAFAEIGRRLRLSENAARMRVERALQKLNTALAQRGIASTTAALSAALAGQVVAAPPAGMAAAVTGAAVAGGATSTVGWLTTIMGLNKLQIGIVSAVAVSSATGYFTQAETNAGLRREIAALQTSEPSVAALRVENQRLANTAAEIELLRQDDVEFQRLAQSAAELKAAKAESARLLRVQDDRRDARTELDRVNREGSALVSQYKFLIQQLANPANTDDVRAKIEVLAKSKLAEIQAKRYEANAIQDRAQLAPAALTSEPLRSASRAEEWTPADNAPIALHIPEADAASLFSAYERTAGSKIARDPSLAGISGVFDFQTPPSTKEELLQAFQSALREHFNIVLEVGADGQVIAKRSSSP